MQVTIEIPDDLARQLEPEREHLAEILKLGLCRRWSNANTLWREVLAFLGRGPTPGEIVEFHASDTAQERLKQLLNRSKEGALTADEKAELDEMLHVDRLITSLKAEAWRYLPATA